MNNKVSVIIPTFNRSALVRKVLPSYLEQGVPIEIILVDDSTDPVERENLRALALEEKCLVLIENEKRRGITGAKNIGVGRASAPFIFFGEDDLFLPPGHLEQLFQHMEMNNADIIGGRKIWLNEGETAEQALEKRRGRKIKPFDTILMQFNSDALIEKDVPAFSLQTNALIRREVFDKIRFNESYAGFVKGYPWKEETDFFLSANSAGFKVMFCPHTVAFNLPIQSGGTHRWSQWRTEYWILKNHCYILRKHKAYIRNTLKNRWPVSVLWFRFLLHRLYGKIRNALWHWKNKKIFK